jgi:extradiol dioxygenase family protein
MAPRRTGRRYWLLYQQRFSEMIFWPGILIVIITAVLLVWQPPQLAGYRLLFALALVVAALVLVLSYFYRLRAYVRCRERDLLVQLPFYRLTIPYSDIRKSRPAELFRLFPPAEQRSTENNFLDPLLGVTVLVIEVSSLPISNRELRLWMSKYMISPDHRGIVLAIRDWIALDTELEELRARSQRTVAPPRQL